MLNGLRFIPQMKKYALLLVPFLLFACEQIERPIEEPLPEFFLTSTITEANETQVKVKGEIASIRTSANDMFGVVYAEKPFPTIENEKLLISGNKGAFDVTVKNLKSKTAYHFRAYLQTEGKIYYSNQLISSSLYDNRWQRLDDMLSDYRYVTGILFFQDFGNDNLSGTFLNKNTKGAGSLLTYGLNWNGLGTRPTKNEWYKSAYDDSDIPLPLQEMYLLYPNKDRIFVGGGFSINKELPVPRVYNQNIFYGAGNAFNLPCPIEGETVGLTVGARMFVLSTKSNDDVYEFTNLKWDKLKNNGFINLGRIITAGTISSTKGYVLSESNNPKTKGGTLYEYDPNNDSWTQKKPFTGEERIEGTMFAAKGKVYYGLGRGKKTLQAYKDIWEYDPLTDNWKQVGFYPGNGNVLVVQGFFKDVVYLGMGYQTSINNINGDEYSGVRDFWVFRP
jgi:hypothetical protein